jgi:nitrite reductase (NADH) small subunit
MAEWYVGKISEFAEGSKKIIEVDGKKIGVYKKNGRFYAYKNLCKHQGGPVCEGLTLGRVEAVLAEDKTFIQERYSDTVTHIVCPWHGMEYNVETGESASNKKLRLDSYEIVERGDECYVIV